MITSETRGYMQGYSGVMTIDLKDKYISSLQCIAEMQQEIMDHKRQIAEFELSSKRMKPTCDEMIQVDFEADTSIQSVLEASDQTLIMSAVGESESVEMEEPETLVNQQTFPMSQDPKTRENEMHMDQDKPTEPQVTELEMIADQFTDTILLESLNLLVF